MTTSVISITAVGVTVVLIVSGAVIGLFLKQARNNGRNEQHLVDIDHRLELLELQGKNGGRVEQHLISIDKKIDGIDESIGNVVASVSGLVDRVSNIEGQRSKK